MDSNKITVKEILERRLGEEKAARVLDGINFAYQKGKRGEGLEEHYKSVLRDEGLDPEDIKFVSSHVVPTS